MQIVKWLLGQSWVSHSSPYIGAIDVWTCRCPLALLYKNHATSCSGRIWLISYHYIVTRWSLVVNHCTYLIFLYSRSRSRPLLNMVEFCDMWSDWEFTCAALGHVYSRVSELGIWIWMPHLVVTLPFSHFNFQRIFLPPYVLLCKILNSSLAHNLAFSWSPKWTLVRMVCYHHDFGWKFQLQHCHKFVNHSCYLPMSFQLWFKHAAEQKKIGGILKNTACNMAFLLNCIA